ncbi:HAD family hydrolase [Candidatus Pseudothioglobus sp. Uisw_041]|uniref:histidinol-phosphatase n=1 Tax=Candidatus Pseudothioglobus sp. Uisw_041 TaxID=3230996 RepID=UPI003A88AB0D
MSLAIFDLDNTLIGGDSDHLWGEFLCDEGIITDRQSFQKKNDYFYQQYELGLLDIYAWAEFSFEILARQSIKELGELHHKFMTAKIEPIILDKAQNCIDNHKINGDTVLVITASNTFVTSPIVKRYGIDHLLATEPEIKLGRYTGKISGTPCFQSGKIDNLMPWMAKNNETLEDSSFYSDSHNDLPLLELVDHPVTINADKILTLEAKKRGWLNLDWR